MPSPAPVISTKPAAPAIDPTPRPSDIAAFKKAQDGAKADISSSLDNFLDGAKPAKAPAAPGGRAVSPKDRAKLPPPDPVRHDGPRYKEPPGTKDEEHDEEVERIESEEDPASPSDDSRSNVLSDDVKNDLDSFMDKEDGKEPAAKAAKEEPAESDDKEIDAELDKHKTTPELRRHARTVIRERRAAQAKAQSIEAKLAQAEAKLKEVEEAAPLRASEEHQKQIAFYEDKLRIADYTASEEFQKQFLSPLQDALTAGYSEIEGVPLNTPDGAQRPAGKDDFNELLRLGNFEATKKAREAFGDFASEVLARRRAVLDANKKMEEAKKSAGEASKKAATERELASVRQRENGMKMYRGKREELAKKYAGFFQDRDGDAEGNALLKSGYDLVEKVISGMPDASDSERLDAITQMHVRAAGFARVARDLKAEKAKRADLEAKLAGYEASEPRSGDTERGSEALAVDDDSLEARMDKFLATSPAR